MSSNKSESEIEYEKNNQDIENNQETENNQEGKLIKIEKY